MSHVFRPLLKRSRGCLAVHHKPDLPSQKDFAIAFKAIALVRGLSGDAKTVGAVILSHFNARTGQCDPGTDRIAAKAGISTRNVVKATNALHESGLVVKTRHGGNGFRSSYQPNWEKLKAIVEAFERSDDATETVNRRASTKCTNVHLDSEQTFTLTHIRNSPKKLTDSDGAIGEVSVKPSGNRSASANVDRVNGLVRGSLQRSRASYRVPPSVASATAEASDRLSAQIENLTETMRSALLRLVDETTRQAAIIEEQKCPGAGLRYLVDRTQSASWRSRNGSVAHDA